MGPLITPRIGQRGLSIAGFAIVLAALLVAAAALYTGHVGILPFAAAAMLWGHYWDAENVVTIPAMVAKPEYRGTATGFAYIFVKLPAFLAIFLFPVLFSAIGQANATLSSPRSTGSSTIRIKPHRSDGGEEGSRMPWQIVSWAQSLSSEQGRQALGRPMGRGSQSLVHPCRKRSCSVPKALAEDRG